MSRKSNIFKNLFETAQEEEARLRLAPLGSTTRGLADLPVQILSSTLEGAIIEVSPTPLADGSVPQERMVVVPVDRTDGSSKLPDGRYKRHDGWWNCIVVYSEIAAYPVGGHKLAISEAELVRGSIVPLPLG